MANFCIFLLLRVHYARILCERSQKDAIQNFGLPLAYTKTHFLLIKNTFGVMLCLYRLIFHTQNMLAFCEQIKY